MQSPFVRRGGAASSSSNVIVFFVFIIASCFLFQINQAKITLPKNITVPAVIAFGDSVIDPGNNNHLRTLAKCNFPPYGKDFMGGIPTGRFSNGKIPTDFLVEGLGIKELLHAYLDPTVEPQDLLTGVSFASGGTGYDPLTSNITSVLSLSDQLNLFKQYMVRLKQIGGEERTKTIVAESIYAICAGSDDLANTYFSTPYRRRNYDVPAYTDLMLRSASNFIQVACLMVFLAIRLRRFYVSNLMVKPIGVHGYTKWVDTTSPTAENPTGLYGLIFSVVHRGVNQYFTGKAKTKPLRNRPVLDLFRFL